MTLQSSGAAISLLNIQNEFKNTDESIESLTGVSKLQPTVWTNNTPFTRIIPTTGTATPSSLVTLTSSSTIETKTSYGSITYSNTSNDDQLSEYSIPINEYYRNGIYVPDRDSSDTLVNQNVPTSGEISLANFYDGKNEDIILYINSNRVNLNLETAFNTESGSGSWTDKRRKRLIINRVSAEGAPIVIGGTSANADKCALRIPSNLIGGLIIINYGYIVGYGGPSQGQDGGNAILVGNSGPTITTNAISSISHNLKFGIYGVIRITGLSDNRYLTPIGPTTGLAGADQLDTDFSIAHGTGEFSVGDSIYIYNKPTELDGSFGDLQNDSSPSTEPLVNLCKISEKQTATFTAYISNGSLGSTAGNILSVISGTQPSIGMGIIKGTSYKKHIISRTDTLSSSNVIFGGTSETNRTKLLYDASFSLGMVIFGTGVEFGTIVKGRKSFSPPSTSFWGTISGTTFTVTNSSATTPTEPILPGYYLTGTFVGTPYIYIVEQLTGTQGKVGTYRVNVDASGSNIDSYGYLELNKSQTITGPVSVTGIRHVLNDDPSDGISTENELNTAGRSMTAVRYILDRNVNTSLDLQNKSSNFKFFTAGGTTSPGFTVTTTQVDPITGSTALSALTGGQSVTISGSTATATGTNTPAINALIFNGTWNNIVKLNDTQFFVATTKIDNTYSTVTGGGGTFPTSTTAPFTVPIKILNYGYIYGGGGGGSNSVASKNFGTLRNYLANRNDGSTTGLFNSTDDELAFRIKLDINGGSNGVGGVGQGYNQAKTLGTAGSKDPNAKKYVYFIGYGNATDWGGVKVNPYLDLISIPPNTEVSLGLFGWMKNSLNIAAMTWKNVYLGSGSSFLTNSWKFPEGPNSNRTITATGTIHSDGSGIGPSKSHLIKIFNLYAFGTDNKISFQPSLANGAPYRQIINFFRPEGNALTISTGWTIDKALTTPKTNPYPTDLVRIITTTKQITYDITFPEQISAPEAGDGGDYGSPGTSVYGYTVANGQAGLFIANSFVYSNVTWVNRGELKGRES